MDDATEKTRTPQPFKETVYVAKEERVHIAKERLVSILLRSQLTDAEYEHLKECSDCVETVKSLQQADRAKGMSAGSK
jgi:hypothetical protein